MNARIPFDLTQKGALTADWVKYYRWPLSPAKLYDIHANLYQRLLLYANSLEPDLRDILLLGRPSEIGALVEAAYVIQAEGKDRYLFGPAELEVLRGRKHQAGVPSVGHHGKMNRFRLRRLRQTVRTMSWSTYKTFTSNLLNPKIIALSHNSLLRNYAKINSSNVGFRHGDILFQNLLDSGLASAVNQEILPFVEDILTNIIDFDDLDQVFTARLRQVIKPFLIESVSRASKTLGRLRNITNLPSAIWTGTGAAYPGRAIGLEVLRRGGEVWRFDHGGTTALSFAHNQFAFNELSVSSHYVMPTRKSATSKMLSKAATSIETIRRIEIHGHNGDPGLDVGKIAFRAKRSAKRRALYVSTAFYGFYQTSTPILPGIPYLEWQIRLVQSLRLLPIDLTCKPHPEGLLRGEVTPINCLAPSSEASFEKELGKTDILIMDIPASTTFSIALTTDRPIVFFNFGLLKFNAEIMKQLSLRCRIINPTCNELNQPLFNQSDLADAVCGGKEVADPTFFRKLLLGSSE